LDLIDMPISSNWPLQAGAIRFFVPHFVLQALAQHPLSQDLFIHGVGFYPKAQGHKMTRTQHDDNLLLYCSGGAGLVKVGQQEQRVGKGDLVVLPQGLAHHYQADGNDPWSLYWVHFGGQHAGAFLDHLALPEHTWVVPVGLHPKLLADFDALLSVRATGYRMNAFIHSSQVLKQCLTYLALLITNRVRQSGHYLDLAAIQAYMEAHLQGEVDLDALAELARLSKFHFSKRYKALTGYSPIQHFIHLKMERACYLLDVSEQSVADVAQALGYDDAHYFSRLFRKVMGVSPREYRLLARG
jgi:AraC-like DNA-binding protein